MIEITNEQFAQALADVTRKPTKAERAKAWSAQLSPERKAEIAAKNKAYAQGHRKERQDSERKSRQAHARWKQGGNHFLAIDGEGWYGKKVTLPRQLKRSKSRTDSIRGLRQDYQLMIAANEHIELVLDTGKALTSVQCLDWLLRLPKGFVNIGFSLGYDVTMILRDLPFDVVKEVYKSEGRRHESGKISWVCWEGYYLHYIPGKVFAVSRNTPAGKSTCMIHDVFGFFQTSFVNTILAWDVCSPEETLVIQEGKARRGDETLKPDRAQEATYSINECKALARIMDKLCLQCGKIGYPLRSYSGAGSIAASMMSVWKVKDHMPEPDNRPPPTIAATAYFGGRFEVGTFGRVGDLYQYDIVSAYPAEIANLPCLRHGSWHETTTYDPHVVGIWKVSYAGGPVLLKGIGLPSLPNEVAIPPFTTWGPLPNRDAEGAITFPMKGIGWYWDVEVRAAISYMTSIGMKYEITSGWVFVPECDEKPFSNMPDAFAARKSYKETGDPAQLVLKLGINSVYGKTAQTVGAGAYACFEWAGMITAGCRAKILDAVSQDPSSIVAIATDAVYSTAPLDLPISDRLGDWSFELDKDVIMYKPGIWWGPAASKTRGFQRNNEMWEKAQAAWDQDGMAGTVAVEVKRFFGVGTCVAWNRPDLMGTWGTLTQTTTMGDPKKRQYGLDKFLWGMLPEVGVVHTVPHHSNKARPAPKEPYVLVESQPYRKLVDLDNDAYLQLVLTLDNEEHIKGGGE